jgi:hypothetical protein
MKKFFHILGVVARMVFLVFPMIGAVVGFVTHSSYGMGIVVCGALGAVLGLIVAAEVVLVGSVLLSILCSFKPFRQER